MPMTNGVEYCETFLFGFSSPVPAGLPPGGSEPAEVGRGALEVEFLDVPESAAPAMMAELPAADYYYLARMHRG